MIIYYQTAPLWMQTQTGSTSQSSSLGNSQYQSLSYASANELTNSSFSSTASSSNLGGGMLTGATEQGGSQQHVFTASTHDTGTGSYQYDRFESLSYSETYKNFSSYSANSTGATSFLSNSFSYYSSTTQGETIVYVGGTSTETRFTYSTTESSSGYTSTSYSSSFGTYLVTYHGGTTTTTMFGAVSFADTITGDVISTTSFSSGSTTYPTTTLVSRTYTDAGISYDTVTGTAYLTSTFTQNAAGGITLVPVYEISPENELALWAVTAAPAGIAWLSSVASSFTKATLSYTGGVLALDSVGINYLSTGFITQTATTITSAPATLTTTTYSSRSGALTGTPYNLPASLSAQTYSGQQYITTRTITALTGTTTTSTFGPSVLTGLGAHTVAYLLVWQTVAALTREVASGGTHGALGFNQLVQVSSVFTSYLYDPTYYVITENSSTTYTASSSQTGAGSNQWNGNTTTFSKQDNGRSLLTANRIDASVTQSPQGIFGPIAQGNGLARAFDTADTGIYSALGAGGAVPYPFWSQVQPGVSTPVLFPQRTTAVAYVSSASSYQSFTYESAAGGILYTRGWGAGTSTSTATGSIGLSGAAVTVQAVDSYAYYYGGSGGIGGIQPRAFMGNWLSLDAGAYYITYVNSTNGTSSSSFSTSAPGTAYLIGLRAALDYASIVTRATLASVSVNTAPPSPLAQNFSVPDLLTNA